MKRPRIARWVVPIVLVLCSASAHAEGKKLALLIGVDKYPEGSGFTSLPYTERDVEQLAEVLLASGYRAEHVRVLTLKRGNENPRLLPTLRNARREANLMAADRKAEDTLLVLPTEAEWEYACRAGTTTRYQGGDDTETLATVGNVSDASAKAIYPFWTSIAGNDGFIHAAPVGRFRANAFGLFDMHGNVWEWCWDCYKADFYEESPGDDPSGPLWFSLRVRRGGSWFFNPAFARSAIRGIDTPVDGHVYTGFRVARARPRL